MINSETPSKRVWVGSAGLWLPGVPNVNAFLAGERGLGELSQEASTPGGKSIEPRSRRRASRLSRAMADACAEAIRDAKLDAATVATVFGSTLGEATTMISLLDQMWRGEEMSPMGFATSVHSAASGTVSISSQNRGFTTSLSADYDTVSAALLEGWGLVQTLGVPVIVVCGDDNSPKDFVPDHEAFDLLAVAISLLPESHVFESGTQPLGSLAWSEVAFGATHESVTVPKIELSARASRNPQAAFVDFAAAILAGTSGTVRLDRGRGNGTCVTYHAGG